MTERVSRRSALGGAGLVLGTAGGWIELTDAGASTSRLPAALEELLSRFQNCPGLSADFEEEKNIVLLAAPLMSSGQVFYHPPHSLARIVEKPKRSHLVVTKKRIVIKEDGQRKEVDLSDKPALRALITSLISVLSGDKKSLLANYDTHVVEEGADAWRLGLVPKGPDLKRWIDSFTLSGTGLALKELRIKESSGDETITRFSNVNAKRKFEKAEIAKIFDI